ncbi:MAG: PEGA domain-containing protein [Spirochaetia bacterium]|jgi:hypothetical protein
MKSIVRVSGFLVVILTILAGPAFGQGFSPKKIWDLTVTVNAPNAVVYVDNVLAPGGTTRVTGGAHNVKVHADGFSDFNGPVVVNGSMTFPVQLAPLGFPLTVRVAAPGARIFVDGTEVTGTSPVVNPGAHSIQVSAPGYQDYNATINVMAPMSYDVFMQPALSLMVNVNVPNAAIAVDSVPIQGNVAFVSRGPHRLSVHADGYLDWNGMVNVQNNMTFAVRLGPAGLPLTIRVSAPGAGVFVDGADVTGTIPRVAPGAHNIRVSAPGFQEYNQTINVNSPLTLDVVLQSANSMLTLVIPPVFRDPEMNPGDSRTDVRIFVDNNLANPDRALQIPIAPGRHSIRIASGAFSVQMGDVVVQPGQSYVAVLSMDMQVQIAPPAQ